MKNSEKKSLLSSISLGALSFVKGVAGGINPIIGAAVGAAEGTVKAIKDEKEKNLNSEIGGLGSIDYPRLFGVAVFILLVYLLVSGKITMDEVDQLTKIFNKTQ